MTAVYFELVDEAVETSGRLSSVFFGLFAGAIVFTAGDALVGRLGYRNRKAINGDAPDAGGLTVVLGALLDGIPESAVLGLTVLQTGEVGAAMLVAVFVSNILEGIAATIGLRNSGWTTARVVALWSVIAVASGLSALAGYVLLDGASPDVLAFVLAFAGGAILTMLATPAMSQEPGMGLVAHRVGARRPVRFTVWGRTDRSEVCDDDEGVDDGLSIANAVLARGRTGRRRPRGHGSRSSCRPSQRCWISGDAGQPRARGPVAPGKAAPLF